jgi:hypothetical protein
VVRARRRWLLASRRFRLRRNRSPKQSSVLASRNGSGDLAVDLKCLCELLTKAVFGRQQTLTTVGGGQDQSQFDLSDQTVDGVSGDIECSDLTGIPAESSMRDGINFNASFDARS